MRTDRLYAKSKRNRTVYLKKMMILAAAFLAAVCLSIFAGRGLVSAHGNSKEDPVDYTYYTSIEVQEGDTLWSIAEEYMDDNFESVESYVKHLEEINQLDSSVIHEGRYLTVSYTDQEFR